MSEKDPREELPAEDDIVIADMNVEGMPWYNPEGSQKAKVDSNYTAREWLYIYRGAIRAALVVALGASAFLILFTLFCVKVWFR